MEILPFYKLRNLFPNKKIKTDERLEILEHCPSSPWGSDRRKDMDQNAEKEESEISIKS
jgi:hypothetical protein